MLLRRLREALFTPVDSAGLVFFRIGFGVLMAWQAWRYLSKGWVEKYWITPDFHFKYPWFEWLDPLPGDGMIVLFYALGLLAVFVAAGFLYRLSAALLFVGHTYAFLVEQARYQNHTYLFCLFAFLAIFLPANRSLSVDAKLWPALRSDVVPAWSLWLVRFQVGVPYFFGGVAKLNDCFAANGETLTAELVGVSVPRLLMV